jgi:transcriptional regulator with XRE-family HTH domain
VPAKAKPQPSLGNYIRSQREVVGLSLRKVADMSGVSAAVLREIETGLRQPSRTIIKSLATALRLSAETLQLQAGLIDPQDLDDADAVREIKRDPHLTARQREILVEIYASFRLLNRSLAPTEEK